MIEKPKILLVEDDQNFGDVLRSYLEMHDYDVTLESDGEAGFRAYSKGTYNLCIFDVMMPKKDGFTLAKEVREKDKEIPIIFLTAKALKEDVLEGFKIGADDYITKPFSAKELRSRVQAALRRTARLQQSELLQHGTLTLDTSAMRVNIDDTEVSLGQTEFKLLQFFLGNPDRVFSREQLLNNVWGLNTFVEERTVDVHILRLRKALRSHGIEKIIDTVRGAGYRLSTPN